MKKYFTLDRMVKIAILSALAGIVNILTPFTLPIFPSFYELDLSDSVIMIGGFALGPVSALMMEFFKVLINLIVNGTKTAYIGEIANFLMGVSFTVPASVIYKLYKTKKGAMISLIAGIFMLTIVSAFANLYLIIPAYSKFMGLDLDTIIKASSKANSKITDLKTLIMWATIPFNFLRGLICSLISMVLYKKVSPILHKKY